MLSMGKTDMDIAEKAIENIKTFLKVATGEKEYKFASEQISEDLSKNILLDKKFLQTKIDEIDLECSKDETKTKTLTLEYTENYSNQRSLNYAYSERKKLFQMGWDSKIGEEYRAGLAKESLNKLQEEEEEVSWKKA